MSLSSKKTRLPPNLSLKEFNFMKYCAKLLKQALTEGKEEVPIRKPSDIHQLPEEFKMTDVFYYILVKITDKTLFYHISTSPTGKYHHKTDPPQLPEEE